MIIGEWEKQRFFVLIEKLSKAEGPSLSEQPRRKILEEFFYDNNLYSKTDSAGNLIVNLGSGPWEETVIFDAHMDVVQQGYTDTISYENGIMKGLGVGDNLTAVSMLAQLAVSLDKKWVNTVMKPLIILFTVGEEGHGNLKGIKQVIKDHAMVAPYLFLSFDLSFEAYSTRGLGSTRYKLDITCPGGHSWEDYGIPSAIDVMNEFFSILTEKFNEVANHYPKAVSFNIGNVEGGEGINSIARSATASFEFRSVLPEPLDQLNHKLTALCEIMNARKDVKLICETTGQRPAALAVKPERIEPLVVDILSDMKEKTRPVIRSTNINATLDAGWPSLCMGLCRSGRFHTPEEYVVIESLEKGWNVLNALVDKLLWNQPD